MYFFKKNLHLLSQVSIYQAKFNFSSFVYPRKNYPFANLASLNDYIAKQENKVSLSELLQGVLEEDPKTVLSTFNTAYFVKHHTPLNAVLMTSALINGIQSQKSGMQTQPFSQGQLLSLANAHYFKHKHLPQGLKEFGICEEMTLAWYFLHFFNKDLIAESNDIIHLLSTHQNLTNTQEELLNALLAFQKSIGHRTFQINDLCLQRTCAMEEYLRKTLRHRYTVLLQNPSSYHRDCENFVQKTLLSSNVAPGSLHLIQAGWQENDNLSERTHVFGYFASPHEELSQFHLFDSNKESCVTETAEHACEKMTEYLHGFMEKMYTNLPFSKFFLRSSTPYVVKTAPILGQKLEETARLSNQHK